MESRKYLKRSAAIKARFYMDMFLLHFTYLSILALLVYSLLSMNYILIATATVSLIATLAIRIQLSKRIMHFFLEDISVWKVIPFEISIIWRQLSYHLSYRKADKNDFTSHKL